MKAVFTFARMSPPTKGHDKLINKVLKEARQNNADHFIYVSQTQNYPNNPLSWHYKVRLLEAMYTGVNIVKDTTIKTPYQALEKLAESYDEIIFVVGDDRIKQFSTMDKYAKEWGANLFEMKSAGKRDESLSTVEGISASRAREYARKGDYKNFAKMLSDKLSDGIKKDIYDKIRQTDEDKDLNKEADDYRKGSLKGEFIYSGRG